MKPNQIVSIQIPIKTVSEANSTEHWSKKYQRHKKQKQAISLYFSGVNKDRVVAAGLPLHILLTRVAPRVLDTGDNLPMAFKSIRDCIASILKPGLQMGRADSDKDFAWHYAQEKGKPKEYGIRIDFYKIPAGS